QLLELADLLCNRRERPGLFAQDVLQPVINGAWGHLLATLVDALGVGRPLKFARGCLDQLRRDSRKVVGISAGQCRIAQGVDQAQGTPRVLVDDGKRLRQEQHTVRRPGGAQPKEKVLSMSSSSTFFALNGLSPKSTSIACRNSTSSSCVWNIFATTTFSSSSDRTFWISVVLPQPISPVITTKPSRFHTV